MKRIPVIDITGRPWRRSDAPTGGIGERDDDDDTDDNFDFGWRRHRRSTSTCRGDRAMADRTDELLERIERLIAAQEHAANAMNRLARALEDQRTRKRMRSARQRRVVLDKPIEVSPCAAAAAKRALAKIRERY